ncbi:hypothetical protein C8R45DRAFT_1131094 [Mycena sanguinolenta]|nr:hypothetical protein C8R45DRAFT_1131094 [Mycena sanguinolenta]
MRIPNYCRKGSEAHSALRITMHSLVAEVISVHVRAEELISQRQVTRRESHYHCLLHTMARIKLQSVGVYVYRADDGQLRSRDTETKARLYAKGSVHIQSSSSHLSTWLALRYTRSTRARAIRLVPELFFLTSFAVFKWLPGKSTRQRTMYRETYNGKRKDGEGSKLPAWMDEISGEGGRTYGEQGRCWGKRYLRTLR